jgi:hypothetical protein
MLFHFSLQFFRMEAKQVSDIKLEKLEENIYVYRGLLKHHVRAVEIFKESEKNPDSSVLFKDWRPWSRFGSYVWDIGKDGNANTDELRDIYHEEKEILDEINNAFLYATKTYLSDHNRSVEYDWSIMGPSISKYNHENAEQRSKAQQGLEMIYHTDYVTPEADWPGNKFILTCTMYLNDDYEGGDITFMLPNKKIIDYKPVAGDVLVFPSGHPDLLSENGKYLHGVKIVSGADKYLIRCFYQKPFAGNPEWLANREKYGEEVWMKMEEERINKLRSEYSRLSEEAYSKELLAKKQSKEFDSIRHEYDVMLSQEEREENDN